MAKKTENKIKEPTGEKKLAIISVRGNVDAPQKIIDTLHMLNLKRKNQCVVVLDTAGHRGMIDKVKDMVTWGEIDHDTFEELVKVRGELFSGRTTDSKQKYNYKMLDIKGKKYKNYFRLSPPRKGFGRKGIKVPFKVGGALGYRGEKINDLIRRML
ncbi:MAG: uL30 family ribosomal protein [Nanoarchaeota archaeon]